MLKLRLGALGLAALSVGVLAPPASAEKVVFKNKGQEATAVVTDCPVGAPAGTRCIAWIAYASQFRVGSDGTVEKFGGLGLDKYRIRITSTGFTTTLVASGFIDSVSLRVADNLSSATASGVVPLTKCNKNGANCTTTDASVSFSLTANAPADFQKGKAVSKFGTCRITERFDFRNRTADGSATVNGTTYPTTPVVPSTIGSSSFTSIARNCTPVGP